MKKVFKRVILAFLLLITLTGLFSVNAAESDRTYREAYLLLQANGNFNNPILSIKKTPVENIIGGWVLDNRGGIPRTDITNPVTTIEDVSTTEGTAFIREFNKITDDIIRADFYVSASGDGFFAEFTDEDGNPVYRIKIIDKKWHILQSDGTYKYLRSATYNSNTKFRVYINLRDGISKTYINDGNYKEHELLSDNILNFRFASDEESVVSYSPSNMQFVANYSVFDDFSLFKPINTYGWKTVSGSYVVDSVSQTLSLKANSSMQASFEEIDIKCAAESQIRVKTGQDAAMLVKAGDETSVKVEIRDGKLYANEKELYTLKYPDMWYKVRILANPGESKADIYLNGRVVGTVMLYTESPIDRFEISSTSGSVSFDDIKVFAVIDHDDYVPEPSQRANLDDYIVAVNICSLWKNTGYSAGWGCISPYEENKPVIGYYDEGVPETADWEIKFMVEHGIDVQSYCWYNNASNGPVKTPWGGDHLHDGYMYAKYSDYIKYMIMWETNATACNSAQFRNYIVPFWFENYFLDDRYLKIDNKIVINAWSVGNLITNKYFGSYEGLKAEIDYLEKVAKEHGFDGVIMLCSITNDSKIYECGFDGSMAYNWGTNGCLYEHNISENETHAKTAQANGYYHIPTVSIGFNGVPWGYNRTPNISVDDYLKCHEWVKNTYLPKYANKSWNKKFVWLSTWNEYGEGTYIMPSKLCGFGYLDAVRSTYTNFSTTHTDHVPDDIQLERITHLFPQYARRLVRLRDNVENVGELTECVNTFKFIPGKTNSISANVTVNSDGSLNGTSRNNDPIIYISGISKTTPVDISDVDIVRVVAKVPENSLMQIFYQTDLHPALNQNGSIDSAKHEKQGATAVASSGEYANYDFYLSHQDTWEGNLFNLRFDPTTFNNAEFQIKKVEFLRSNIDVNINGIKMNSGILPDLFNTRLLFPYDTDTCVQYNLHTHYTWRKDEGLFILEGNGHKAEFNVGSDIYIIDGEERELGYTMYLKDGVPMLDFELLAEDFGYEHQRTENGLFINTPEKKMYDEYLIKDSAAWEFNGVDAEGFIPVEATASAVNGYLHIDSPGLSSNPDPQILTQRPLDIPYSEYNVLEMRVRYEFQKKTKDKLQIFFATQKSTSFSEDKSFTIPLTSNTSNGEWVTYRVVLSDNKYWNDIATRIRIDPFNAKGFMDIDYIRFSFDKSYVNKLNPLGLVSGNAAGITTESSKFYSTGSTLSVVEDPGPNSNPGNQVYLVTCKPNGKYIFFRHDVMLRMGATYKVAFDIKLVGDSSGNTDVTTSVVCDFTYSDSLNERTDGGHHFGHTKNISPSDGWVHIEKTFTVKNIDDYTGHQAGFFTDPTSSGNGASFMVDNFSIVEV